MHCPIGAHLALHPALSYHLKQSRVFDVSSVKIINSGVQTPGAPTHITDTLTMLARALVMAVLFHYVWLTDGSSLYKRADSLHRALPRASAPKDHVPKPQSSRPGCERPSLLVFKPQCLTLDLGNGRPSQTVFAPHDNPSRSARERLLLQNSEKPRTSLKVPSLSEKPSSAREQSSPLASVLKNHLPVPESSREGEERPSPL